MYNHMSLSIKCIWIYSLPGSNLLPSAVCYHILISLIMPFNLVSEALLFQGEKVCMCFTELWNSSQGQKHYLILWSLLAGIMKWKEIIPEKPGIKYVATRITREVSLSHMASFLLCCVCVCSAALYKLSKRLYLNPWH